MYFLTHVIAVNPFHSLKFIQSWKRKLMTFVNTPTVSFKYPADNLAYMLLYLGCPNRKTTLKPSQIKSTYIIHMSWTLHVIQAIIILLPHPTIINCNAYIIKNNYSYTKHYCTVTLYLDLERFEVEKPRSVTLIGMVRKGRKQSEATDSVGNQMQVPLVWQKFRVKKVIIWP